MKVKCHIYAVKMLKLHKSCYMEKLEDVMILMLTSLLLHEHLSPKLPRVAAAENEKHI